MEKLKIVVKSVLKNYKRNVAIVAAFASLGFLLGNITAWSIVGAFCIVAYEAFDIIITPDDE